MRQPIVIVDYGMGNLGSIQNMLRRLGFDSQSTSDRSEIEKAKKIILPGVGAFDHAMKNLKDRDLTAVLHIKAKETKIPILGICLGMQIMTKGSQEGVLPGLGWVDAHTNKFKFEADNSSLKIPHMGWNSIEVKKEAPLFSHLPNAPRFYFVHSYCVQCNEKDDILAMTRHGYDFVSIFQHENIIGVQFHPEKSHRFGMEILKNFAEAPC